MKAFNPYSSRAEHLVMAVILVNSVVILLDCSGCHRPLAHQLRLRGCDGERQQRRDAPTYQGFGGENR